MDCELSSRLGQYLDGSLSESLSEQLERHLGECGICSRLLAQTLEGGEQPWWLQLARGGLSSDRSADVVSVDRAAGDVAAVDRAAVDGRAAVSGLVYPVLPLRYRVLRRLGQGGMGVVWECLDEVLGRSVAIKVLRSVAATEHESQRLLQEAAVLGRLNHSGIVRVLGLESVAGQPALVMELLSGPSLSDFLRDRTLGDRDAAWAAASLAGALAYAHRQGVIHRDLKPANILLDDLAGVSVDESVGGLPTGLFAGRRLLISDFGTARLSQQQTVTQAGQLLGTPAWMSPEQASGDVSRVTASTDIYSLGVVLYQMLTGRVPFVTDDPVTTLALVRTEPPLSPRLIQPRIARDLENICLKCLSKSSADRYGTAELLEGDLRAFLEGRPVQARPLGPHVQLYRWSQRHRGVATLLAIILLLLSATAIGLQVVVMREKRLRADADQGRAAANQMKGQVESQNAQIEGQLIEAVKLMESLLISTLSNGPEFFTELTAKRQDFLRDARQVYGRYLQHFMKKRPLQLQDLNAAIRYLWLIQQGGGAEVPEEVIAAIEQCFAGLAADLRDSPQVMDLEVRFLEVNAGVYARAGDHSAAAGVWLRSIELLTRRSRILEGKPDQWVPDQLRYLSAANAAIEFRIAGQVVEAERAQREAVHGAIALNDRLGRPPQDELRLVFWLLIHGDLLQQLGDSAGARGAWAMGRQRLGLTQWPAGPMASEAERFRQDLSSRLGE